MTERLYCNETGIGTGDLVRHKWEGWRGIVRNLVRLHVPYRCHTELFDARWRTGFSFPQEVVAADVERDDKRFSGGVERVPTIELELIEEECLDASNREHPESTST